MNVAACGAGFGTAAGTGIAGGEAAIIIDSAGYNVNVGVRWLR